MFPIICYFHKQVGPFHIKQITGNKVETMSFSTLSVEEIHYLIGLVFFSQTKVKFNISTDTKGSLLLQELNPWHIKGKKPSSCPKEKVSIGIEGPSGQDGVTIVSQIIFCYELATLRSDQRSMEINIIKYPVSELINKKKQLDRLKGIKSIGIKSVRLRKGGYAVNTLIQNFPHLEKLTITSCQMVNETIIDIKKSLLLLKENLKVLSVGSNQIDDDGVEVLSEIIPFFCCLEEFDLSYNQFGDRGAIALSKSFLNNSVLKNINLQQNQICNRGAEAFAEIFKTTNIDTFRFNDNKLTSVEKKTLEAAWYESGRLIVNGSWNKAGMFL